MSGDTRTGVTGRQAAHVSAMQRRSGADDKASRLPLIEVEEARDPDAAVSLGEIVAFGSRLCQVGERRIDAKADSAGMAVIGVDARLFQAHPVKVWRARAERLHGDGQISVWDVRVFMDSPQPLATATFHLQLNVAVRTELLSGIPTADAEVPNSDMLREPASTRRREQIAAAACDVIARKGFASATMRDIAAAAGLHVPTMYQYVTSKDEMLELVYHWIMDSVRTDVIGAADPHRSATEKMRAVMTAIIQRGDRFRHRIGVLNRELKSLSPPARRRVLDEYRALLNQIASLVADGVASGEFRDVNPSIAANIIDAACDIWPLRPFAVAGLDHEVFTQEVLDFVTAGLSRGNARSI